jgi:hypothetical protein
MIPVGKVATDILREEMTFDAILKEDLAEIWKLDDPDDTK